MQEIKDIQMPDNVLTKGTFLGIPRRRWIETIIVDTATILIVTASPLVVGAKIMLGLILFMCLTTLFVRGIKNRSVMQILFSYIRYTRRKRKLHLCTPNYVKRIRYEEVANESFVEYISRLCTRKINQFVDRYAPEENSTEHKENSKIK